MAQCAARCPHFCHPVLLMQFIIPLDGTVTSTKCLVLSNNLLTLHLWLGTHKFWLNMYHERPHQKL